MKIFEKEESNRKKEYLKYVSKKIQHLIIRAEKNGTKIEKEKANQRMNSYERNLLRYYLTDKHLIETIEYYLEESNNEFTQTDKYTLEMTYNEVLKHKLIHILLKSY